MKMRKIKTLWIENKNYILVHFIFWVYIGLQTLSSILLAEESKPFYLFLFELVLNIFNFYLFYYILSKIFTVVRYRYLKVLISVISILMFTIFRAYMWKYFDIIIMQQMTSVLALNSKMFHYQVRSVVVTTIYVILIKFTVDWFRNQQIKSTLLNQNQSSELALLRFQLSPHFFFNTLNNIYTLVYKKSDEAPEAVMRLSEIMRYMLYESNTDFVDLKTEVEYLNSFIELQLLRVKEREFVSFNINGGLEGKQIAPMLLIPFVENAFKHGNKDILPGLFIGLNVDENNLSFIVTNFKKKSINTIGNDKIGGIGLQNVKRRLDLLYPGKFKLKITENNTNFTVELFLDI